MKLNIKLPKELTTITKTSKTLAFIVFITLPFLGFFLGMNYQSSLDSTYQTPSTEPILPRRVPTPTPSQTSASREPNGSADTSTWKTYVDSKWNISFKYPEEWFIFTPQTSGIGNVITLANFDITNIQPKGNEQTKLRINIYRDTTDKTLDAYIASLKSQGTVLTIEKVAIAGVEGIKQETEGLGKSITVYVLKNGYVYLFTASPSNSNYISFFDQTLQTFKFTN